MKTNLALHLSAIKAALDNRDLENLHAVDTAALERFNEEQQDPEDWDYWFNEFERTRNHYIGLNKQSARSETVKAQKEAAAKVEAAATALEAAQAAQAEKTAPKPAAVPAVKSATAKAEVS